MVGPDWKGTVVTAVCIIVPAILYFSITYVGVVLLCCSSVWVAGNAQSCGGCDM